MTTSLSQMTAALDAMAVYRDWVVDAQHTPSDATQRGQYRWTAHSERDRVVALFADFYARDVRRRNTATACTLPSRNAILDAITIANTESAALCPRRLVIIVLHSAPTRGQFDSATLHAIAEYEHALRGQIRVEPWHVHDLDIDPIAHCCTPPHRRATSDECAKHDRAALPVLRADDPVARWRGYETGDIIVFERESAEFGRQPYLRQVVDVDSSHIDDTSTSITSASANATVRAQ